MQNKIFLLSHQDDEIAIFNHIKMSIQSKDKIYIFYLTNGRIKKIEDEKIINIREKETTKVLKKIGVEEKNIIFLGKKLQTNSYELYKKLDITFRELSKYFTELKNDTIIYSHSWEGGNTDHDSSYIITLKLIKRFSVIKSAFQFLIAIFISLADSFSFNALSNNGKNSSSLAKRNAIICDILNSLGNNFPVIT